MRKVLYQKYRPTKFSDTVGQDSIKRIIVNAITQDQLPHGYIFAGERGTGKTTFAKIIAKAINCLNWNGDVCNQCEACQAINSNSAIDVFEIDAASKNGINDIRELAENVFNLPFKFKKKVYILDEAHMLTPQSWSGLLKTLEEAPDYVLFIFATTEFNKIPITILSRCQSFFFKQITNDLIQQRLAEVAAKESIKITTDALVKLADLAQGSLRDGLSLLDQISNFSESKTISLADVEKTFNLLDKEQKFGFIEAVLSGDLKQSFHLIDNFESQGINFVHFLRELFALTVDLYGYVKTGQIAVVKPSDQTMAAKLRFHPKQYALLVQAIEANNGYGPSQLSLSDQIKAIVIHYKNAVSKEPHIPAYTPVVQTQSPAKEPVPSKTVEEAKPQLPAKEPVLYKVIEEPKVSSFVKDPVASKLIEQPQTIVQPEAQQEITEVEQPTETSPAPATDLFGLAIKPEVVRKRGRRPLSVENTDFFQPAVKKLIQPVSKPAPIKLIEPSDNNPVSIPIKLNRAVIAVSVYGHNDPKLVAHFQQLLDSFKREFTQAEKTKDSSYLKQFSDKFTASDLSKVIKVLAASPFGLVLIFEDKEIATRLWKEALTEATAQATLLEIFQQNLFLSSFTLSEYETKVLAKVEQLTHKPQVLQLQQLEQLSSTVVKKAQKTAAQEIADTFFKGLYEEK